jgi:hypothetical protein
VILRICFIAMLCIAPSATYGFESDEHRQIGDLSLDLVAAIVRQRCEMLPAIASDSLSSDPMCETPNWTVASEILEEFQKEAARRRDTETEVVKVTIHTEISFNASIIFLILRTCWHHCC